MATSRNGGDGTLTGRQRTLLDYILRCRRERGELPSLQELARHLGVTPMAAAAHLDALARKGLILRKPRHRPSYALPAEGTERFPLVHTALLPVYGSIAAGEPLEPLHDPPIEYLPVQSDLLAGGAEHYLLRVRGDSMIGDGIRPGDLIVVRRQRTAEQGEMIVALIESSYATLKRFYREGNRIRLQPSNAYMEPIYSRHVDVQGKVVALLRRYD